MKKETNQTVDHLFRSEYGKMVAVLTRIFGPENLSMVEDVVQDTFIKALKSWSLNKIPDKPEAWLYKVAKNRAIDIIRSKKRFDAHQLNFSTLSSIEEKVDHHFLEHEIPDSQLRLIFMCCMQDLDTRDIVALTLKIVSGFGIKEIATALMQKRETIKKRIQRARKKLQKQKGIILQPSTLLTEKIGHVNQIIYLIFNEGYYSPHNEKILKKELCLEAMRLAKLVCDHPFVRNPESQALLALMCYHAARIESRRPTTRDLILLENQDRKLWDQELIKVGHYYYSKALKINKYSEYHLEAAIAAKHILAKSIQDTDWTRMLHLYKLLYSIKPFPSVLLNLIVVLIKNGQLKDAKLKFDTLDKNQFLPNPYLYFAVGAKLYGQLGDISFAEQLLQSAIEYADHPAEKEMLRRRLKSLTN